MKVTVECAQLLKSLGHVHRVVERRNTIPILGNVLIRAEGPRLALKATDLDLEVTETLAADTATAGSTTVPAHMFYDIVRKLPDGSQIVLESDGDRAVLAIRAGRSRFTLQTLPESDFPDLAAGDMSHAFSLSAADLKVVWPLDDGRRIHIDVFASFVIGGELYILGEKRGRFDLDDLLPLGTVTLDGHEFAAPRHPEAIAA